MSILVYLWELLYVCACGAQRTILNVITQTSVTIFIETGTLGIL